jgi:predicted component of type VI protein secretion system
MDKAICLVQTTNTNAGVNLDVALMFEALDDVAPHRMAGSIHAAPPGSGATDRHRVTIR